MGSREISIGWSTLHTFTWGRKTKTILFLHIKLNGFYTNIGSKVWHTTTYAKCPTQRPCGMNLHACSFVTWKKRHEIQFYVRRKYLGNHHAINDCISSRVSNCSMVDPFSNSSFTFSLDQSIYVPNSWYSKKLSTQPSKLYLNANQ